MTDPSLDGCCLFHCTLVKDVYPQCTVHFYTCPVFRLSLILEWWYMNSVNTVSQVLRTYTLRSYLIITKFTTLSMVQWNAMLYYSRGFLSGTGDMGK